MAITPSTMLTLGTPLPEFSLPDINGKLAGARDYDASPALLVVFMCNHCPFVKHVRPELINIATDYQRGLAVIAINSNDAAAYPEDSPAKMVEDAHRYAYPFPYLYDAEQSVAKSLRAACTPDFYLFDRDRRLVYRGRMDASTPGNDVPLTGNELRLAIEAVLEGKALPVDQHPSIGCNIKWKSGNEPQYYLPAA